MGKKILVLGGTGSLGGHAAVHLAGLGHEVTIAGRNPAHPDTPMAKMPFLKGNYVEGDFTADRLAGFDWVVHAAGADPRHVPEGVAPEAYFEKANAQAVPAFFAAARDAGVARGVQVGSLYQQAEPELVAGNRYIQSRAAACEGARALSTDSFAVMSLNAPFMVGTVPGLPSAMFSAYVQWAKGLIPIEPYAPAGGTNFLSNRSLSQAIAAALDRGAGGHAYLLGDQNLSFREYFQLFFDAAGSDVTVEERDAEQPMLPDVAIPQGRGNYIRYEPDAEEVALLGYDRNDIARAVREVVTEYLPETAS